MKAIVVYESYWGNTAAVARAIADGLGGGARALDTDEVASDALMGVVLVVAGSPIIAFNLPSDKTRSDMSVRPDKKAPKPPDLSHPTLR
jgi:flavodoxin